MYYSYITGVFPIREPYLKLFLKLGDPNLGSHVNFIEYKLFLSYFSHTRAVGNVIRGHLRVSGCAINQRADGKYINRSRCIAAVLCIVIT